MYNKEGKYDYIYTQKKTYGRPKKHILFLKLRQTFADIVENGFFRAGVFSWFPGIYVEMS